MAIAAITTVPLLSVLDEDVAARGMKADPTAVLLLAHAARDLGVNDTLVSLMVDEGEPEVARIRAYAKVASAVSSRVHVPIEERVLQHAC